MILGISWLCKLGKVLMDWKETSMRFLYQEEELRLIGDAMGVTLGGENGLEWGNHTFVLHEFL